jgi:predicted RNase H-like nuclease (RuvC/YqgF family)
MKSGAAMLFLLAFAASSSANASDASPIEKVLQMISDLQSKVIAEGTDAQKTYDEYAEWCEDRSTNLGFEIKTGKAEVAELTATIEQATSTISALETKIEELSSSINTDEADLDAASKIREKEAADFAAEEKELTEVLSMLDRATQILSKEMAKSGASMLQLKNANNVADALKAMVQASMLSSADASKLTALVQTEQDSSSGDSELDMGAPAASVYEGHSDGIIGTLEGLTEKAQGQLDKARKAETSSLQNFQMLKQSLTDEVEFAEKDMAKAKKGMAETQEKKATAEGDLDVTSKDLAEDISTKGTLHQDCMSAAEEFEMATKSRGEELKALATAKKVIAESTGGAAGQSYGFGQMSFLQVDRTRLSNSADLAKLEAVRFVRDLARKSKSPALAQLASRMSSAMRLGAAAGEDPFSKVKQLITDMISTLEADAESDASHKAYCDKETSEATAKKDELTAESNKLETKIAQDKAASAKLKEEVAALQKELANMAKAKAEASQLRSEEKAAFDKNSAEMKQGIEGVKMALKVLKEYYAKGDKSHEAASGAGSSIIGLLEVCESDFTKGLTEMTAEEDTAASEYEAYVKEDAVAQTMKEQDAKYKTKEAASLDKNVADLSTDLSSVSDELSAVLSGLEKLGKMCIAKAEPYAEIKARRESEIAGLKEALEILESETALLQKTSKHALRGGSAHNIA